MTQEELDKIAEDVLSVLTSNGTNVSEATVVDDVGKVSNIVAYDEEGKVVRVTPETLEQKTKNDVIKHVRGRGEENIAYLDPFKYLGKNEDYTDYSQYGSVNELLNKLSTMNGNTQAASSKHIGVFRALLNNAVVTIINTPLDVANNKWTQTVMGCFRIVDGNLATGYTNYGVFFRQCGYGVWDSWKLANEDTIRGWIETMSADEGFVEEKVNSARTELEKRIQGTSDNSSAWGDAFRRMPDYTTLEQLDSVLRNWHGETVDGTKGFVGNFRTNVAGIPVEIFSTVLGYGDKNVSGDTSVWVQEIKGAVAIDKGANNHLGGENNRGYTDTAYTSDSRTWYSRAYKQGLRFASALDATGIHTLRRIYNGSLGGWGEWIDVTNPYITSPLYGKNLLILGGSFAHNMQAYTSDGNTGFGFKVEGREYAFQNYIAKELGLKRFDNFAVSGNGACINNFNYDIYTQLTNALSNADAKGYKYDAIIIAGGINDYQNHSPLGVLSEAMNDSTFYGSYKKIINRARTYNPDVKLFMTTPFKAFHLTECWNSTSTVVNNAGHKYYEYLQALKDIAQWASIPLLDIFAIQQVDLNNYGEFYRVNDNDATHPNGKGYKAVAPAMLEFLAWGKGMETFDNEALTLKLKDRIADEEERAKQAEKNLHERIDNLPTGGGSTGDIMDGAVTERKLSTDVQIKLNDAYNKANLSSSLCVNDGITLKIGALLENSDVVAPTSYRAYSNIILSNNETIFVNEGYVLYSYKVFENGIEIAYHTDVNAKEFSLDGKDLYYQLEFKKMDDSPFKQDELKSVVKSFIRNPYVWGADSDMNKFIAVGVYDISGERTMSAEYDHLPIDNRGGGHTISARLEVLDASISDTTNNDDKIVMQKLTLLNRVGGDGNVFIRIARGRTYGSLVWDDWQQLQTNVNVGFVDNLDGFIDNGMYNGIWQDRINTVYETFVLVVINNHSLANSFGKDRRVTQLKYSCLDGVTDEVMSIKTRYLIGDDDWSEWAELKGGGSVDLSGYYTKEEINNKPFVTAEPAGEEVEDVPEYITRTDLDNAIAEAITNTINTPI